MKETPHSLLERLCQRPDAGSWKRLVDLYTPLLRAWLAAQLPPADVDDLVQDVLTVVVRELANFRHNSHRGAFRSWLRAITFNRLKGYWRARRPGRAIAVGGDGAVMLNGIADPASDPDKHWEREHDEFIVRRALELLEPEFSATTWQAFWRQVIDGAKPAEVGAELELTPNAAVLAKFRVLRRLRQELDGLTDSCP